jgi:hypothetical protein
MPAKRTLNIIKINIQSVGINLRRIPAEFPKTKYKGYGNHA